MQTDWTKSAKAMEGEKFARFQASLSKFNHKRLSPTLPSKDWRDFVKEEADVALAEGEFIETARRKVAHLVADVPQDTEAFIAWFEGLTDNGPGQGDPLFPWLAEHASL